MSHRHSVGILAQVAIFVAQPTLCTMASALVCTVYTYQNMASPDCINQVWVHNGRISFVSSTHATPWHGHFIVDELPRTLLLRFHCRGDVDNLKVTRVMQTGHDDWEGLDCRGNYIKMRRREQYRLDVVAQVWVRI